MQKYFYLLALLHPLSVITGIYLGGVWIFSTIALNLIIFPLAEFIWEYRIRPPSRQIPQLKGGSNIQAITIYSVATLQLGLVAWLVCVGYKNLAGPSLLVVCYSIGLCSGSNGITISHELMHRHNRFASGVSWILLFATSYPWFRLQHLRRHHRLVATNADPATAKYNQGLYSFYRQSIGIGFIDIFKTEAIRSAQKGYNRWNLLQNSAIQCLIALIFIYASIWFNFGLKSLGAFIFQGIVGILVLETINYIQHYGLTRNIEDKYVTSNHSWDTDSITNYALFNLGCHSDHHKYPIKKFHSLGAQKDSPKMPYGYFTMALIALLPTLWKGLMNQRIPRNDNQHSITAQKNQSIG